MLEIVGTFEFQAVLRLVLGFILSGLIGIERSSWNKPAGFRTHTLVGISAVLVMLCGEYMSQMYDIDPSRIPAQLLSGIGFIGAGTILRDGFNVKGLTTASSLLAVTCIGLSVGAGFYVGGIVATIIVYIILSYSYILSGKIDHFNYMEIQILIDKEKEQTMKQIENLLNQRGIIIKKIDNKTIGENDEKIIKIICKYNSKMNKNTIINDISNLENINKVEEIM